MSYSYEQRKKRIKCFKKQYGKEWYSKFCEFVKELETKKLGMPISLVDAMSISRPI